MLLCTELFPLGTMIISQMGQMWSNDHYWSTSEVQISQIRVNKHRMPNDAVILLSKNLLIQTQVNISRRGFFLQKSVDSLVKSRLSLGSSVFFIFLFVSMPKWLLTLLQKSFDAWPDQTRPWSLVWKMCIKIIMSVVIRKCWQNIKKIKDIKTADTTVHSSTSSDKMSIKWQTFCTLCQSHQSIRSQHEGPPSHVHPDATWPQVG